MNFAKKNRIGFIGLIILLSWSISYSQDYTIDNGGTVNTCSGNFYDSGGTIGDYSSGESFTMTFCSDVAGDQIVIDFTMFELEIFFDDLSIYDGPNTLSTQIPGSPFSGTTSPGIVTSSSGCLTFEFNSDASANFPGWEAAISCISPPPPTCSDGIQNQGETGIDCGGPCAACDILISSGGTINTCSGTFYDSGGNGANYSNGELNEMTICSSTPGEVVVVDFLMFDIENIFDDLFIYDGPNTGSAQIPGSPFTGTLSPGTVTSSSGCLTFVFESDISVSDIGWEAVISCIVPPPPTCSDGIQNQGEIDIDCGGPCAPCVGVYISEGGTVNVCGDVFYDSGGPSGFYGNNEDELITICPSIPGQAVVLDFTSFDVEGTVAGDVLCVYDGLDILAPTFGCYSNDSPLTGIVQANNPSGCVTFWFQSSGSITNDGWVADISCTTLCQTVIATANFSPAPDPDGVIRLCQGDDLQLNGVGVYPDNGFSYTQSDGTSTFDWFTGDGGTQTGQNFSYNYPVEGGFLIQLEISDIEGCSNANDIDQLVYVSTTPNFAGSIANPDPICAGDPSDITGVVTPVLYEIICTVPNFPSLSLPDGSGVSYQASVNLDCYLPGQTLDNINDLFDICLNMEHSYMGDLNIAIQCPSGEVIDLVNYPGNGGGGTYLGIPVDNDGQPAAQGTGFDYCWSPTATNGTWGANSGGTLAAGTYEAQDNMAGLVGCTMNGDWTVIITDNLASDNGFIFSWNINFDPALLSTTTTFTPTIVNSSWLPDPTIVSGTNPITVEPIIAGSACYVFEVEDNFGCFYDTTICITVDLSPVLDPPNDIIVCGDYVLPSITGSNLTNNEAYFTGALGTGTQYNAGDVITSSISLFVYDVLSVAPFCDDEEPLTITIVPMLIDAGPDQIVCVGGTNVTIGADPITLTEGANYTWSSAAGSGTIAFSNPGQDNGQVVVAPSVTTDYFLEISFDGCIVNDTVTIFVDVPPTASNPLPMDVECFADILGQDPTVVTDENDNGATPTVAWEDDTSDGLSCPETILRRYRVTDDCANFIFVTQTIIIEPTTVPVVPADGLSTVNCLVDAQVVPTAPAGIVDVCGNPLTPVVTTPADIACEGDMVYTFTYTDCAGNTADWLYTYTIDIPAFTIPYTNDVSVVNCVIDAQVQPADPGVVVDMCGTTLLPVITAPSPTGCTGVGAVWIFTYTDCAGNTADWTYTYTVALAPFVIPFADDASTVNCLVDAQVEPIPPGVVNDACGNVIVPVVTTPADIACEGTMTYVFTYTDCAGNTSDWSYVYTIDILAIAVPVVPANGLSTVDCLVDAQVLPTAPAGIVDVCGNVLVPVMVAPADIPCEGDMVYTFTYTDCSGNTTDWLYTYTINIPAFTVPADVSEAVVCIADVVVPTPPSGIVDACGTAVVPVMTENADPVCLGDKIYTFTYTDCSGNIAVWTYTISINDNVAPVMAAAPGPVSVQCGAIPAMTTLAYTDNCDAPGTVAGTDGPLVGGNCGGTITRTWSFTDACGNIASVSQIITVDDTIDPTATDPAPQVGLPPVFDPAQVTDAADNCGVPTITDGGDISSVGTCPQIITREYIITDACLNTISVFQTFTIEDPILTLNDTTVCSPTLVDLTDPLISSTNVPPLAYYTDPGLSLFVPDPTSVGAGTYYVEATNANGICPSIGIVTVTVTPTPILTLNDTTVCSPLTVDITAGAVSSTDVGTMLYYSDVAMTILVADATAVGAGTYYVEATNAGCTANGSITVTVNTTPTITFPLIDPAVCSPLTVDITLATVASTDIGTLSYYTDAGLSIPVADPTAVGAGIYYVEATSNGCSSNGSVTAIVTITPTLTFPLIDPAVCSPATVDITVGTVASTDIGTLSYYTDAGLSIPVADPTAVGAGIYYVEATNNGCSSNGSVTAIVSTTPTLTLADPAPVCSPLTVDITAGAVSSSDVGAMLYYSDVAMTILVPDATAVGDGTYYIEATNSGCASNGSVTVIVVTTPEVDPHGPITACDTYTLPVITGLNLTGTEAYYDAAGGLGNVVTAPITSSTTLFIYDGVSGCSDEQIVVITINPLPTVTVVSGGDTYCEGDAVSDILVDVTGTANFTVDYTLDGAVLSASGTTNPLSLGNAAGVYIITNITDGNTCTNGANGSQTIVVNPIPSAPLAGTDSEYCSTVEPNLMTVSGGAGTYTWYSDASLTSVLGTETTLNPSTSLGLTTYYVTETEFGCEGPSSQVNISIIGCEITIPTAFTPDGDLMNDDWEIVDLDLTYPNNIVYVYNRWGNLLFTSEQGSYDSRRWDGTSKEELLPVGSYYFIIEFNDKENKTATGVVSIILNK